MAKDNKKTPDIPTWLKDSSPASYPKLAEDLQTDVVIIGGGLAGTVTAYLLAKEGKRVVLLEKDTIGAGATGLTTAFLSQYIDIDPRDLIKMFGDNARLVWQSGAAAIDEIERIIRDEDIACDFSRCFAYAYAGKKDALVQLAAKQKAIRQLGFETEITEGGLQFNNAGYLVIPNQGKFHPLKFLQAVGERASAAGVRIFEHTGAVSLSESGQVNVVTDGGRTVQAAQAVVATHWPFNNPKPTHFKKGLYRSYVLELSLPPGAVNEGIYWDQSNPYNYFRVDRNGSSDRMILGGADHRAELPIPPDKSYRALERYAKQLLGKIKYSVVRRWRGLIIESSDGLPLIGAYAPDHYVATAFSGNGMTYSVVSAMIFRDLMLGRKNPWSSLYDPNRKLGLYRLWKKGLYYAARFFGGAVKNTLS